MSVPSVLVQKSTKQILRYAPYPKLIVEPFDEGDLDPDLEWLVIYQPFAEPDYDPRIYLPVRNEPNLNFLNTFQEHPQYPGIKAYVVTFTVERRPNDEIITSIDNAEKYHNSLFWTEGEHKDKQLLMMNASLKASTGATLNSYEEELLSDMNTIAVKLSKNRDNRNVLVAMVNANLVPNIDEGWENV